MAITLNGNNQNVNKATATSFALATAWNTGDLLLAITVWKSGSGTASTSDNTGQGNTWNSLGQSANGTTVTVGVWWAVANGSTASGTITTNFPSSSASAMYVFSFTGWTGTPTIDVAAASGSGTGTVLYELNETTSPGTSQADGIWFVAQGVNGPGSDGITATGSGVATGPSNFALGTTGGSQTSNVIAAGSYFRNAAAGTGAIWNTDSISRAWAGIGATWYDLVASLVPYASIYPQILPQ